MNIKAQRLIATLGSALLMTAVLASAAQARPDDGGGSGTAAVPADRPDDRAGPIGTSAWVLREHAQLEQTAAVRPDDRAGLRGPGGTEAPVVTASVANDRFEWGTAEVGTAVALLVALLAAAALFAIHLRQRPLAH